MLKQFALFLLSLLNGGPDDSRLHRIVMTLSVIALTGFTASALGKFTIFGFNGFARASDMKEMRIDQLDDKIETAVKGQCLAPTSDSKWYYYEKIKLLKRKYQVIDPAYAPPNCRDLGVPDVQVTTP